MSGYPQGHQQGYADPFNDRHSPSPYGQGQAAPPPNNGNGNGPTYGQQQQHPLGTAPYSQQAGQQRRPTAGYALHDNPSYTNSMQTLPMDSSYSLAHDKLDYDGGVYPDEDTESKTPLRSEFGHPPGGTYDPDQPLCVVWSASRRGRRLRTFRGVRSRGAHVMDTRLTRTGLTVRRRRYAAGGYAPQPAGSYAGYPQSSAGHSAGSHKLTRKQTAAEVRYDSCC